jgi:hypothetical protein
MKKYIVIGIAGLVLLVAGMVALGSKPKSEETAKQSATETSDSTKGKKACDLIPLETAKKIIGENAVVLEGSGSANAATTEDVTVDNCSYSADGATLGDMKQIVIQVHHGDKTQVRQSYDNYKKEYPGEALPQLGETAYYSEKTNQAIVLDGNSWFFVGAGSINAGNEANKQMAIQAALLAKEKLAE